MYRRVQGILADLFARTSVSYILFDKEAEGNGIITHGNTCPWLKSSTHRSTRVMLKTSTGLAHENKAFLSGCTVHRMQTLQPPASAAATLH